MNYEKFHGLYPVSKTLRFELRPQGRTATYFEKSDLLEDDQDKAEKYKVVKSILDDCHRDFITRILSSSKIDWNSLYKAFKDFQTNSKGSKRSFFKKNFEDTEENTRKQIVKMFTDDPQFEYMSNEKLLSKIALPVVEKGGDRQKIDAMQAFQRFSGYYIGYHEARANLYVSDDKNSAIAHRCVNDNFVTFCGNMARLDEAVKSYPEIYQDLDREWGEKVDAELLCSVNRYNELLTQKGIDSYNDMIAGFVPAAGSKTKGVNELLNLYAQKGGKKIRLDLLKKQIMGNSKRASYVPKSFENDSQALATVNEYVDKVEKGRFISRAVMLIGHLDDQSPDGIYICGKEIPRLSLALFSRWDALGALMQAYYAEAIGDVHLEKNMKKVKKELSEKEFSLDLIEKILDGSNCEITKYAQKVEELGEKVTSALCVYRKAAIKNLNDSNAVERIKNILDGYLDLFHALSVFEVDHTLPRDDVFYSEFDEIYDGFSDAIPIYNAVRARITKKKYSVNKIKMNFGCSGLAKGWDLNKENEHRAFIFQYCENYYLGIVNPKPPVVEGSKACKNRINFDKLAVSELSEPCYDKMVYKFLPDPKKMFPKVFFSKKNIAFYAPSDELLSGYKAGMHVQGPNFDPKYCHELIDFFKRSIEKHPDWSKFGFTFSATEDYHNIGEFYKEVSDQGYKVSFQHIPVREINELVNNGQMFLFKLYNKDFSPRSHGNPNMHTLYWRALFSSQNLASPVIRLNGEAELFFRKRSIEQDQQTIHRPGEVLVDRTTEEGPIPASIYQELMNYFNGRARSLSPEARPYETRISKHKVDYSIIKDRRYTVDEMFFHVPLILNYNAPQRTDINQMVVQNVLNNNDVCIIGIDRGERNLIYYSVIDRHGNIKDQDSLNLIDGFNYQEKLDQREHERDFARKSWTIIEDIRKLKEGYLSQAVRKVVDLAIKNNAIIVMEDLNYGFKRGRFKIEKQVYQKFEEMLINKLSYLVDKGVKDPASSGGPLNGYQLVQPFEGLKKLGKQTGIIFYVPPAYTSKIDPVTGFVDVFNHSQDTVSAKKEFVCKFRRFAYLAEENVFEISFDYRDYIQTEKDATNLWTVCSYGQRIIYNSKDKTYVVIDPTESLKQAFANSKISTHNGKDLMPEIREVIDGGDSKLAGEIYWNFRRIVQMRNSDGQHDYIVSPVRGPDGHFFDSRAVRKDGAHQLPTDGDANGAYHIALKGELMLQLIEKSYVPDKKTMMPKIEHSEWIAFAQTRKV